MEVSRSGLMRPPRLRVGDAVAAVSLSFGGPGAMPARYASGKRQLETEFGLDVIDAPHACADPGWLADHPEARAEDLMWAFTEPRVRGIISTIGGDDSVRLLPHLDLEVIADNPKVFVGSSDTTVTHLACHRAGLATFYGPSVMTGFAENGGLHRFLIDSFRKVVFDSEPIGTLTPNPDGWTDEFLDWTDPSNQERPRALYPAGPWRFDGSGQRAGTLIGGCADVLEFVKGSPWWPAPAWWDGAVLFLETSEERPPPEVLARWVRSYATQGILHRLAAVLVGRPQGSNDPNVAAAYEQAVLGVIRGEEGLDIPVVTGMDFGHTDPVLTLPYGATCIVDAVNQTIALPEPAVTPRNQ